MRFQFNEAMSFEALQRHIGRNRHLKGIVVFVLNLIRHSSCSESSVV